MGTLGKRLLRSAKEGRAIVRGEAVRQYIGLIHKGPDSDYGVSFPDLPGVITAAPSLDEAHGMATEALALHLEGMVEDGKAIPEPSSLEAIMADQENRRGVAVLIAAPALGASPVRINITIPADLLDAIDQFTKSKGLTRSAFLTQAAKKAMESA